MKTPPEPRRRKTVDKVWLKYLHARANSIVSEYFAPHDDQTVTIRRGDLRRLIAEYEKG